MLKITFIHKINILLTLAILFGCGPTDKSRKLNEKHSNDGQLPIITSISPSEGSTFGNDVITIHGSGFSGSSVKIGEVRCITQAVSPTLITCTTEPHERGWVDVMVTNSEGEEGILQGGFHYNNTQPSGLQPPANPPAPLWPLVRPARQNLEQLRPAAVFGAYEDSEAEALANARAIRLRQRRYLETARLRGIDVNISRNVPNAQVDVFFVLDENLAREAGINVGDGLSRDQVGKNRAFIALVVNMDNPRMIRVERGAMNPEFNPRVIDAQQLLYLNHIREQVDDWIGDLNSQHGGYYRNPHHNSGGSFTVNSEAGSFSRETFSALLTSIEESSENDFINHVVSLATLYGPFTAEPKRAFIDVFTYLFVTKNFPSEGMQKKYFEFVLTCGYLL